MSREYFVNRHGTKSNIEGAVDEISAQEIVQPSAQYVTKKHPKPHRRFSFTKLRISKKLALIVLAVVVISGLGSLLVMDAARREYQLQTAEMHSSIKDLQSKTFSTETSAKDASHELSAQLIASTNCHVNGTFLANLYTPAQKAASECRSTAKIYNDLQLSLTDMFVVTSYFEKQKAVLSGALSPPTDGMFAEIPSEAKSWQEAYDKLVKIGPPGQVKTAHGHLTASVKEVVTAWNELQTAQNTQNTDAFTVSEAKLTKAYETLRLSGAELGLVVENIQKTINEKVQALL